MRLFSVLAHSSLGVCLGVQAATEGSIEACSHLTNGRAWQEIATARACTNPFYPGRFATPADYPTTTAPNAADGRRHPDMLFVNAAPGSY